MQLNIPVIADMEMIRRRRQARIDHNNDRENAKRLRKDYNVGDEILIIKERPGKLEARAIGPFQIQQTHTNGTVTIMRTPGVYERINIRRIKPFIR